MVDERGQLVLENFQALHGSILAYSFTDDARDPASSVSELLKYFKNASIEHREIQPSQLGIHSIDPMGFFRESETIRTTLWAETSDWLASA